MVQHLFMYVCIVGPVDSSEQMYLKKIKKKADHLQNNIMFVYLKKMYMSLCIVLTVNVKKTGCEVH